MNEDLAIAILTIIKNGESFGLLNVLNEVRELPEFFDLNQTDFTITWNKLKEIDCLIPHELANFGHRGGVKLNPNRDCLSIYLKKRADLTPIEKPHPQKKRRVKKIIQKIGIWIISNIWALILLVLGGILAAYLIAKFKIPH